MTPDEATTRRAKIVREALRSLEHAPKCGPAFWLIAQDADDETLAKLGRLLR